MSDEKLEVVGITIVRAPGGRLVLVSGPIDLSRAESLSPREVREVRLTKPRDIPREPDNMGHVAIDRGVPVLTKVGEEVVHGEAVERVGRRGHRELAKLLNAAMLEVPQPLEVLEKLQRTTKPLPKQHKEPAKVRAVKQERALGFVGKSDEYVRRELLKLGRKPQQVEAYLRQRGAA